MTPEETFETEIACWRYWDQASKYSKFQRWEHFKRAALLQWPFLEQTWNSWLDVQIRSVCDDMTPVKVIPWTGCATSGKTFAASLIAFLWWMIEPEKSAVTITSTTGKMIRKRVWPVIQQLYYDLRFEKPGRIIDSQTKLVALRGNDKRSDDKHSISAIAVAEGETIKAVNDIKGLHCPRIGLIIDEAESTPEAIFAAIPNLRKGCKELLVIITGNSSSRIDPHGQVCEPSMGWSSIGPGNDKWTTKGVGKWQIPPSVCYHFDGHNSPNVLEGKNKWPFLYTVDDYKNSLEPSVQESFSYWVHDRGFWPPSGMEYTILDETIVVKYKAAESFIFISFSEPFAFLDPAFGGDVCKVVFGSVGDVSMGKKAIQITESVAIPIAPSSKHEVDFQIASSFIEMCRSRGIEPQHAGMDATGIGRGVYAIVCNQWSSRIWRGEWGASASDRPAGASDTRPAKDVYANAVTEMWFAVRDAVISGVLRGLYPEAIEQFCKRRYEKRSTTYGKYILEDKSSFRSRQGRSPDDADAVAGLIEIARQNGLVIDNGAAEREKTMAWQETEKELENLVSETYMEPAMFENV